MDSITVYMKTSLGQEEIATRARQLPARVRTVLIMVDGRRSAAELIAQSPVPSDAESHLATLLEAGLVEAVAAPPPAPTAVPAPAPVRKVDLAALKDFICIALHEAIGPDADLFAVKIEAASNLADLMRQAEKARDVIRSSAGSKKAEQYWDKLLAMLA